MRDKIFRDRRQEKFFPGSGQPLVTPRSSEEPAILQSVKPSKDSSPKDSLPVGRHLEETSKPPGR